MNFGEPIEGYDFCEITEDVKKLWNDDLTEGFVTVGYRKKSTDGSKVRIFVHSAPKETMNHQKVQRAYDEIAEIVLGAVTREKAAESMKEKSLFQ